MNDKNKGKVKVFFWDAEGGGHSVILSEETDFLLENYARKLKIRTISVLREVLGLFGQITESNVITLIQTQSVRPN